MNNYRLKRAKARMENPFAKTTTNKSYKLAKLALLVVVMSAIIYTICFGNRMPMVPNSLSHQNRHLHIVSTITFSYTSDILTKQKQDLASERIPPRYKIDEKTINNADIFCSDILKEFNNMQNEYLLRVKNGTKDEFFKELSTTLQKKFLLENEELTPEDIAIIYEHTTEKSREHIFKRIMSITNTILSNGVYANNDTTFANNKENLIPASNVNKETSTHAVSEKIARRSLENKIKSLYSTEEQVRTVLCNIFIRCIKPNIIYDEQTTKQERADAKNKIQPVNIEIRKGETLADANSINEPLTKERLDAYKKELLKRDDGYMNTVPKYVNFLVCMLLVLLATLFITISKSYGYRKSKTIYIFCTLLIFNLVVERFIIDFANVHNWKTYTVLQIITYAIPLILGPIIQVLLFGSYLGFIMSIVISALTTLMLGETMAFFVLSLTASVVAIYLCDGATNRYKVIFAGTVYGAFTAICVFIIGIFLRNPFQAICMQVFTAFLSGIFTSIIALATLPILELLFKRYSNITLLDYTDLNNKKASLLKKLQIVAQGTYHHSVMVSYIAEAAAQAVKANSMVCRVGALYHDIGKLSKPEYFSENQTKANPHDEQTPSMSALIIKNHVSDGIAQAEVEKMPHQIIDAISQHHGTSLIEYFYRKAKENNSTSTEIDEELYRHLGEKPKTVENAIIMIADSCEAASRAEGKNIKKLVDEIVNKKMTDGQFDECPITVKQISLIKKNVVQTLLNINHSRVKYKK